MNLSKISFQLYILYHGQKKMAVRHGVSQWICTFCSAGCGSIWLPTSCTPVCSVLCLDSLCCVGSIGPITSYVSQDMLLQRLSGEWVQDQSNVFVNLSLYQSMTLDSLCEVMKLSALRMPNPDNEAFVRIPWLWWRPRFMALINCFSYKS